MFWIKKRDEFRNPYISVQPNWWQRVSLFTFIVLKVAKTPEGTALVVQALFTLFILLQQRK